MSAPESAGAFLTAVWRYLSVAGLYQPEHPYRASVAEDAHRALVELLERDGSPSFSFLAGEVIYGASPLRALRSGDWATRMEKAGVTRIEAQRGVTGDETATFLRGIYERLGAADEDENDAGVDGREAAADESGEAAATDAHAPPAAAAAGETIRLPHIQYGPLGIEEDRPARGSRQEREVTLDVEAGAVGWLHERIEREGTAPIAESMAVVRSLSVAMHGAQRLIVPFLRIKDSDQYTAGHCINVSILSMSLAEEIGLQAATVQAVGAAGLLHDVGKVMVPAEILSKPGSLTAEERAVIERHPVDGSRILMGSGEDMALPAVIAYEHHMGWEEGGYPTPHYDRRPARLSRLVQVCDFYDALRTRRHYRAPLPAPRVIGILEENAGSTLDPELARAFIEMIRRWDPAAILAEAPNGDGSPAPAPEPRQEAGVELAGAAQVADDTALAF